jgi:hypothetical protein
MAANTINVQLLADSGEKVISKAVGYFTDTINANSVLISANTLRFANNNVGSCIVDVEEVQYTSSMLGGYVRLYYSGAEESEIVAISTGTGTINKTISNSANTPTGNVVIDVYNAQSGDSFTIIVTGRKVSGFANAALTYASL